MNDTNSTDLHDYNIGRGKSLKLLDFIKAIENELGIKSEMRFYLNNLLIYFKHSDCTKLKTDYNYTPKTDLVMGKNVYKMV